MRGLEDKNIVLGVSGGIAAYKAADLASKLTQAGAAVYVLMTPAAQEFVTPLTFRSLTGQPVTTDMFDQQSSFAVQHVALAGMAHAVVVAPATAHTLARLASGLADEPVSLTVLATTAPVLLAPAMDGGMWDNPATQQNIARLKERGFTIVGPAYGRLASGKEGWGRMEEPATIMDTLRYVLGQDGDLAGKKVVVTAGGTQEPLDPVRHLTNLSSGKMGFAVAEAARDRGAQTVLVYAPTHLTPPVGVEAVPVRTAQQMKEAVDKALPGAHALIMAAAVADFRPVKYEAHKVKKGAGEGLVLEMERTPDILQGARGDFVRVGFAAESDDLLNSATQKLRGKSLHLIAANDITAADSGFATDANRVTLIDQEGGVEALPLLPKLEVAHRILDRVAGYLKERSHKGQSLDIQITTPSWMEFGVIGIPTERRSFFPGARGRFILETDSGPMRCRATSVPSPEAIRGGESQDIRYLVGNLKSWYDAHPELQVGSKLKIEALEPGKRYRLAIEQP